MRTKNTAPENNADMHPALLECTSLYRVFLGEGITVKGKNGTPVETERVDGGVAGTGQVDIEVTAPSQILVREGLAPDGKKALYLVRVPKENQIFEPK
jgi:hypothetical protein